MRVLFNAAMRWELIPYQHNPMSLVRVKDSSKRQREPKALSVDEFQKVLENIPEPFRTMCIVAMCLGLRVSEILGLRWNAMDWEGLRLAVRQAYVYGMQGDVKTQASHRWMPLDRSLAERLRQHKARLAPMAKSEDWVFANPETGKRYWPGRIQELARPRSREGGDRPDRLADVPQSFNVTSCAGCRSQGAAGTFATCRCSNVNEHLHAGRSQCSARGE
jgi:integrase